MMKELDGHAAHLNGLHWKELEFEEQAYVRQLLHRGKARLVNRRVELRGPSKTPEREGATD